MATLGYTTTPTAGQNNPYVGAVYYYKVTATENGTVDSISFYWKAQPAATYKMKGCIWASDNSILGVSNESTGTTLFAWHQMTFPGTKPTITSGQDYYLGGMFDSRPSTAFKYDVGTADDYASSTTGSYASPGDLNNNLTQGWKYGVYITYTPVVGPSITIEGITPTSVEAVSWGDISDIA